MGVIPSKKSLIECESIAASAFARRRLPVVMVRLKFAGAGLSNAAFAFSYCNLLIQKR